MRSRTALVAGTLYVVLGVLFLLDRLDVLSISGAYMLPVLLIGLGAAIIAGSLRRPAREPAPEPAPPSEPTDPGPSDDDA